MLRWLVLAPGVLVGVAAGLWLLVFVVSLISRELFDRPLETPEIADLSWPDFFEADLVGVVTSVADGDTLTLVADDRSHKVRLGGIDAPESNQPGGRAARRALIRKTRGKTVQVDVSEVDQYDRLVAQVRLGVRDINRELVREGHAWVYREYSWDPLLYLEERAAREQQRGLWARSDPIPPWEWRRRER